MSNKQVESFINSPIDRSEPSELQPLNIDSNFQTRALTEQRKTNMTYPNTATTEIAQMR